MTERSDPAWFETLSSQQVYEGFSNVRVDTVRTPTGEEVEREIVERVGAVAVVAVDVEDRLLLVRQYRHAVGGYLLEVPAGLLDVEGEDPDDAARRELAEEIGYRAGPLTELVTVANSAGWSTERTRIFLASGCEPTSPPDGFVAVAEEADMEVVPMSIDDALQAAHAGVITDAKSLIGILLAESHLRPR